MTVNVLVQADAIQAEGFADAKAAFAAFDVETDRLFANAFDALPSLVARLRFASLVDTYIIHAGLIVPTNRPTTSLFGTAARIIPTRIDHK